MPRYIDVSIQHIQSYLVRAQHLKGRRGASTMITRATSPDAITRCLNGLPARLHSEAGAVDGVVSVCLDSPDAVLTAQVTDRIVDHLRSALPAAFIVAISRDGSSYADAVAGGTGESQYPAVCAEWPAAKRCEWCNIWPVSAQIVDGAGEETRTRDVCRDCELRSDAAGRSTQEGWKPLAETRLRRHLGDLPGSGQLRELPTDFDHLADLGPVDGERNHVATVLADGNGIGKLISTLRGAAQHGGADSQLLREAPRTIDDATWAALTMAVAAIDSAGVADWRVVPHLVGGDDLLVSVPAHSAWEFVRVYLAEFSAGVSALARDDLVPSASTGVVFHQIKEPFSVVTDLAHSLLDTAKKEHRGRRAALCWQSITHDGSAQIRGRRSLTLDGLQGSWDALTGFAAVPKSQRQVLARMVREGQELAPQLDRVRAGEETMSSIASPFLGPGAPIPLEQAIGMVEWWWPR